MGITNIDTDVLRAMDPNFLYSFIRKEVINGVKKVRVWLQALKF